MNTRYPGNRWGNIPRTIASLFIGVSLIVSSCSRAPPQTIIAPNQTVPNTTKPEPPHALVPEPTPAPAPAANTPAPTPEPAPAPTPEPAPSPPPTPAPGPAPAPEPQPAPTPPQGKSYSKDVQRIFNMFCLSCHDIAGESPLNLMPEVSYKMLVGVPSNQNGSMLRVKPSSPDESFILIKLKIDTEHCTPPPQSAIDTIKQWILEGAKNN